MEAHFCRVIGQCARVRRPATVPQCIHHPHDNPALFYRRMAMDLLRLTHRSQKQHLLGRKSGRGTPEFQHQQFDHDHGTAMITHTVFLIPPLSFTLKLAAAAPKLFVPLFMLMLKVILATLLGIMLRISTYPVQLRLKKFTLQWSATIHFSRGFLKFIFN